MTRVVAYARVSTDHDDQKNSLRAQIAFFEEEFHKRTYERADCGCYYKRERRGSKNFSREVVNGFYVDEGISGTSMKNRYAFNQMIADAKMGKFDMIITKSVSRFSRSVEDGTKILKDMKEIGVGVIFLNENKNSLDPNDEAFINFHLVFAQQESLQKSMNVQFGIQRAQKEGKWIATTPYGYVKENGKLQKKDEEAQVVKLIFDLYYNEGYGTGKICRYLNTRNIPTQKGALWQQPQIASILDNQLYKGTQVTHVYQTDDINRHTQRIVPKEERFVLQSEDLQIVTSELFQLVQVERKRRRELRLQDGTDGTPSKGNRYSNQHLFSNLLYCGNCGSALKRKQRNSRRKDGTRKDLGYEWVCNMNDTYGKQRCSYRNAYAEDYITQYVRDEVTRHVANKQGHEITLENYLYTYYNADEVDVQLRHINEEIQNVESDIEVGFTLYKKKIITDDQFGQRNNRLQSQLTELRQRRADLSLTNQHIEQVKAKYNEFASLLNTFDTSKLSNVTLRKLISKIVVSTVPEDFHQYVEEPKGIEIVWSFLGTDDEQIILDMADLDIAMMKRNGTWNTEEIDLEEFDPEGLPFDE